MKRSILQTFLILFLLSCNEQQEKYSPAENALDGGREFVDACLKGSFDKAKYYMIDDEANNGFLLKLKRDYNTQSKEEKQQYQQASININDVQEVDDSITIISYKNSFDKISRKIKVIKTKDKDWLVDFKYTFSGNL